MFNFLKSKLSKIYSSVTSKLGNLFGAHAVDEQTLQQLRTILIEADTGVRTTNQLIMHLEKEMKAGKIAQGTDLKIALADQLTSLLSHYQPPSDCSVFLMVGINGSGKTTFTGKLAHHYKQLGKKVLLVAADTFRAAATEQLASWAQSIGVDIEIGKHGQDPASVVYAGCQRFKQDAYDILIIDTAGRLQTKINLMNELEKIKRSITKQLPDHAICTLLTVDSMLGQNSFDQAKLFHESTQLSGIVLTKMDGTGSGGIVFSITQELHIPVMFVSFGEQPDQFKLFNAREYVNELLSA